ncbi:hypothetical protein V2J09_015368 [Rumex salicifolius]
MDEIEGLFAEEEPSLGEIKQAFDVFDRNGDGFIDAFELNGVLSSLGLLKSELDLEVHNIQPIMKLVRLKDDNGLFGPNTSRSKLG